MSETNVAASTFATLSINSAKQSPGAWGKSPLFGDCFGGGTPPRNDIGESLRYTTCMTRARIGLFGGTFDPPHLGHLILASEACEQLELTRLLWVLTPEPPHKLEKSITSAQHRLAMVKLATSGDTRFEVSSIELERPGPHYTLDTVNLVAD